MDEFSKEFIKTSTEVVLRPITEVAENVLGLAGGDWLSERRARNRARLHIETEKILTERNVKGEEPPPCVVVPLLSAAQDEHRDALVTMWAKLLAAAIDPTRATAYRREYVEIVKQLEPVDVQILPMLGSGAAMAPTRALLIAANLEINTDEIEVSFRNLQRLDLIRTPKDGNPQVYPILTSVSRRLLALVS